MRHGVVQLAEPEQGGAQLVVRAEESGPLHLRQGFARRVRGFLGLAGRVLDRAHADEAVRPHLLGTEIEHFVLLVDGLLGEAHAARLVENARDQALDERGTHPPRTRGPLHALAGDRDRFFEPLRGAQHRAQPDPQTLVRGPQRDPPRSADPRRACTGASCGMRPPGRRARRRAACSLRHRHLPRPRASARETTPSRSSPSRAARRAWMSRSAGLRETSASSCVSASRSFFHCGDSPWLAWTT